MAHSRLSPSAASRWVSCPASVKMLDGLPDEPSPEAQEGADAHAVASIAIRGGLPCQNSLGDTVEGVIVTQEMVDSAQEYVDYTQKLDGHLEVERRVRVPLIDENQFGTIDAVVNSGDTLHIIDFKHGFIPVSANRNYQLMLYAMGYMSELDLNPLDVRLHVVQPRVHNTNVWETNAATIYNMVERVIKPAALEAYSSNPRFGPSESACVYCPVARTCPALRREVGPALEPDLVFQENNTLTLESVLALTPKIGLVRQLCDAIEEAAIGHLLSGGHIDGFKLVESRKHKVWKGNSDETEAALIELGLDESTIFQRKIIRPSQAAKVLKSIGEDLPNSLWEKPTGEPRLAKNTDKRKATL